MSKKESFDPSEEKEYKGVFGIRRLLIIIIFIALLVTIFQVLSESVSFEIGVIASMIIFVYGFL